MSAVNSDDDDLLLHRSGRDVMSDEHMDLSKTRIEEPLVSCLLKRFYVSYHIQEKIWH